MAERESADATATTFYFGARAELATGADVATVGEDAHFSTNIDAAIWAAELAEGEGEPRVYRVAVAGPYDDTAKDSGYVAPPYPAMSLRAVGPVVVIDEVLEWTHYHGTRAQLVIGDLIEPGFAANFGPAPRTANFVYFARTLEASIWGAELAAGDAPERIYVVEPTGPYEPDPNLTNVRFRGNPTKSFRSRSPLRIIGELSEWKGHSPDIVRVMKERLARLDDAGVVPEDD